MTLWEWLDRNAPPADSPMMKAMAASWVKAIDGDILNEIEEIVATSKKIPGWCPVHQHYKWCECNGGALGPTGYEAPCGNCNGTGQRPVYSAGEEMVAGFIPCPKCNGTGLEGPWLEDE